MNQARKRLLISLDIGETVTIRVDGREARITLNGRRSGRRANLTFEAPEAFQVSRHRPARAAEGSEERKQ